MIKRIINSMAIEQKKDTGYINAEELSKSVGKKSLNDYLKLKHTKEYIIELTKQLNCSIHELIRGDFIHPALAIHYAYWLSPIAGVKVYKWVEEWFRNEIKEEVPLSDFNKALKQALEFNPKGKG